jgi:hypothetical protein
MAHGIKLNMHCITELIRSESLLHRKLSLIGLSLASAVALAQSADHLNPNASFDSRQTDTIFDGAGQWRQAEPEENLWRSAPENSVDDRRFHFGADSAYEEMQYQSNDRFRTKGSLYDEYRPSPLFRYNF